MCRRKLPAPAKVPGLGFVLDRLGAFAQGRDLSRVKTIGILRRKLGLRLLPMFGILSRGTPRFLPDLVGTKPDAFDLILFHRVPLSLPMKPTRRRPGKFRGTAGSPGEFPSRGIAMNQIVPFDLGRLLLADQPPVFLAEVALRVAVVLVWTMVLLRWVGGRSIAQMSVVEFLLVIALGSAVGDPMFQPETPLLPAMLVILLVVLFDKAVDLVLSRWRHAKRVVDGVPVEVVRDGVIQQEGIAARNHGPTELMEKLRLSGIRNLGQVQRAYLEPSGQLSVFQRKHAQPGLRIVPPVELTAKDRAVTTEATCCVECGDIAEMPTRPCANCGAST